RTVGEGYGAERVVVVAGRNPDVIEIDHGRLHGAAVGAVITDLAEGLDVVGQVVTPGQEQVQPLDRRTDRRVVTGVIAHIAMRAVEGVVARRDADVVTDIGGTAEAAGLIMEGPI